MKNILFLILVFVFSFSFGVKAQSPDLINYQAVARDLLGNPLVSTAVVITYDIRQNSSAGSIVYSETHNLTTNQFGLFTAQIGGGTPVTGTFSGINWGAGLYYLQVTVNGDVMTATQLLSVPYALHANTATSGIPGANGHANLADSVAEPAGVNCANGGYLIHMGADDNDNNTLEPLERDISYYICNGLDGSANNNDTSATNEIQTLSINGDTLFLSKGGLFVLLPPALGDDWGSQVVVSSGSNISGDGTIGNPLSVFDNDTSSTNEIELPASGTINDVLTWNGTNWVAQVAPSGADNWGSQVVVTTGANISGDGTSGNPLSVFDNDTSATNEFQNLSITGNSLNISSGTGTQISPVNPNTGDLLYWNGVNWVAQAVAGNTDNQNLLNGGKAGNNQTINIQNGTGISFSVADGDSSNFNEYNTSFQVNGPNLELTDGGNTFQVPLTNLGDNDWTVAGANTFSLNNVGVGINSPSYQFHVHDPSAVATLITTTNSATGSNLSDGLAIGIDNAGNALFTNREATDTRIMTNNQTRILVNSTGDVSIGSGTPTNKLDVDGQIRMRSGAANGYIPVSNLSGVMTWTDPATLALGSAWLVNGTDIYNGNSGQVGIGTTTPSFPLEVRTTSNNRGAYIEVSGANSSTQSKIGVTGISTGGLGTADNKGGSFNAIGGSSGDNIGVEGIATTGTAANIGVKGWSTAGNGNWAGYFGGGGVGSGNVYIQDRLGINSTAPTVPLHVEGNTQLNGVTQIGGTTGLAATLKVFSGFGAATAYFFDSGGNPTLTLSSGGDVTIGQQTQVGKFFIQDNDANTTGASGSFISVQNLANATNTSAGIRFRTGGSSAVNGDFHYKGAIFFEDGTGSNGEGDMIFAVNNVASNANVTTANAVMTIKNTARVGIGTTAPNSKLHVNETTTDPAMRVQVNGITQFIVANNGNVALNNNAAPAYKLHLSTNSAAKPTTNTWTVASDARLKTNVKPFAGGLSDVLKINPVWFTYNGKAGMPNETGVGIIAQELKKIAPFMVNEWEYRATDEKTGEPVGAPETYLGVDNGAMTYMLINAIKEQQKMIEELKLEVEKLKKQ